jgi:hypothetical protein
VGFLFSLWLIKCLYSPPPKKKSNHFLYSFIKKKELLYDVSIDHHAKRGEDEKIKETEKHCAAAQNKQTYTQGSILP